MRNCSAASHGLPNHHLAGKPQDPADRKKYAAMLREAFQPFVRSLPKTAEENLLNDSVTEEELKRFPLFAALALLRRTSPAGVHQTRKRVPFSRGHTLRLFHKPAVQIIRANEIWVDIACVHSQASGAQTCELSRVPLWR